MGKRLKVLYVSPEVIPFAKTGGLADVAGSLPKAIRELKHDVRIIMPLYKCILEGNHDIRSLDTKVAIPLGLKRVEGDIYQGDLGGVPVYFLRKDEFYYRDYLYSNPDGDYQDNARRFIFFSRSILEILKKIDFLPDIIHSNDWQSGLVSVYLNTLFKSTSPYSKVAALYTIHNIAYQGVFPASDLPLTGLPEKVFNPQGIEFWGKINFMKGGILFSDIVNTVSEGYGKEIKTEEFGYGLEGVLKDREEDFYGILNGVDYNNWNPLNDRFISANYNGNDLSGKKKCKDDLLKEYGLNLSIYTPLIGIISRLADQKGFDILSEAMEELISMNLGIVLLGTGNRQYHEIFEALAIKYPKKLGIKIAFNNALAHKIEAGSDLFLMPSRYEPCGLNQIYSLRYGTIPIVRATGGLDDTIEDYNPSKQRGNGFKFREYSSQALVSKVKEAIKVFKDRRVWKNLVIRAMKEDFSWKRSAKRYEDLYYKAITKKEGTNT
ncbi:MAG: glycogen synthase GlgA [Thermodesulfobacteriota bacterium]